ncbi:hypothetical protein ACS0TY_013026 [Phlomoides rotata]
MSKLSIFWEVMTLLQVLTGNYLCEKIHKQTKEAVDGTAGGIGYVINKQTATIKFKTYDDVAFGHTFQSAWACHDLLKVLCQLSERGHASFVRSILGNPLSCCPEVLPLGMAHVNTAYSLIQNEVASVVLPVILKQAIILHILHKMLHSQIETGISNFVFVKNDTRKVKEETNPMAKGKGQIYLQILEKQRRCASLESDSYTFYQVQRFSLCKYGYFTDSAFKENPAAVCLLKEERDEEWLQAVAREFNISETCYLTRLTDSPDSPNGPVPRFLLRWFTHVAESIICIGKQGFLGY